MDNKIRNVAQQWSRDSSVGVMCRLRAGGLRVRFLVETIYSLLENLQTSSGTHSASYSVSTPGFSLSGIKQSGRDAEYFI
jgi:hypothetical protein